MVTTNSGSGYKSRAVLNPIRSAKPKPSLSPRSTKTMLLQHTISYTRTSRARRRSRRPRSRLEHPAYRAPTGRRRAPQWYRTHYTGGSQHRHQQRLPIPIRTNQMLATQIKKMSQYSENKPHKKGNLDQRTKENKKRDLSVNRRP
jgi:hypothetical protein